MILLLNDIRSVHNVGSIMRIADCAGIKEVYLCGITPTPVDRFGNKRKDFAKVSLGAEESVRWMYEKDIKVLLRKFKEKSHRTRHILALEQGPSSIDYKKIKISSDQPKTILVLGNEVKGIDPTVLELCDQTIEIPMLGQKESLNVAVATGIAVFRLKNI